MIIALTAVVLVVIRAVGNTKEKALDADSYKVGRFVNSMKCMDGDLS